MNPRTKNSSSTKLAELPATTRFQGCLESVKVDSISMNCCHAVVTDSRDRAKARSSPRQRTWVPVTPIPHHRQVQSLAPAPYGRVQGGLWPGTSELVPQRDRDHQSGRDRELRPLARVRGAFGFPRPRFPIVTHALSDTPTKHREHYSRNTTRLRRCSSS